jgi:hypothetical protein
VSLPARATLNAAMSEEQLQRAIIKAAKLHGWRVAHFRAARTEKGWRTPVEGDPGFPDLVLARRGDVFFIECKSEKGRVSPEQKAWWSSLIPRCRVIRPSDLDEVLKWLA